MDFVSSLPKPLSARSREFLAIWHGWRGDRMVPNRGSLSLPKLGELAGTCLLLNVRGHDDVLIEWVGEAISKQIGVDLAGCNYLDLTSKENRSWRAHLTMAQVAQPCSAVIYYWLRLGRGGILPVELVSAPFCEDGAKQATLMLCCASNLTPVAGDKAIDPSSYEEGEGMRFIDIGAGIPTMVPSQRQEARPVQ